MSDVEEIYMKLSKRSDAIRGEIQNKKHAIHLLENEQHRVESRMKTIYPLIALKDAEKYLRGRQGSAIDG